MACFTHPLSQPVPRRTFHPLVFNKPLTTHWQDHVVPINRKPVLNASILRVCLLYQIFQRYRTKSLEVPSFPFPKMLPTLKEQSRSLACSLSGLFFFCSSKVTLVVSDVEVQLQKRQKAMLELDCLCAEKRAHKSKPIVLFNNRNNCRSSQERKGQKLLIMSWVRKSSNESLR